MSEDKPKTPEQALAEELDHPEETPTTGRPPKYKTVEEMQHVIDLYFLACRVNSGKVKVKGLEGNLSAEDMAALMEIDDEIPTVCGLALALDLSRQALIDYQGKGQFLDTIRKAKLRVENSLEQRLGSGKQAAGTIFNLKNNFGWKDKTEQELTHKTSIEDMTDEELDEYIRQRS